jgi:hypothetical protein
MRIAGIALIWIGALCVAFRLHWLLGLGLLLVSISACWKAYKDWKFTRDALRPAAGVLLKQPRARYKSMADEAAAKQRREMGYDT